LERKRRPTMMDLEIRGIVPRGYFEDAESAMNDKKLRRENVISDLTRRLAERPEFSEKWASKLMSKAMESVAKQNEMVQSATSPQGKETISQILTAKMAQRMGFEELKSKNILPSHYNPQTSRNLMAQQLSLHKEQRKGVLSQQINARPDVEELYDSGLIHYRHDQGVSAMIQPAAAELEQRVKHRVDGGYLRKSGILYDSELMAQLDTKMKRRPSIGDLEQRAIVPHGAFEDLESAKKLQSDRRLSITDELNAFFSEDRPSRVLLVQRNILMDNKKPRGRRDSVEMKVNDANDADTDHSDDDDNSDPRLPVFDGSSSPVIPAIPERPSAMFRSNTYTEVVMSSIAFNNKRAVEPSVEIDTLVAAPDLDDAMLATSTLSFLNVVDNLETAISMAIDRAKKTVHRQNAAEIDGAAVPEERPPESSGVRPGGEQRCRCHRVRPFGRRPAGHRGPLGADQGATARALRYGQ